MILEYGDATKLKDEPWYMVELRSEKTIESTMRRVGKAIPSIFRNDPIEIFIPVFKRDLDVFEMKTGCYIFVRSTSFQSLLRLKTITGVVSLVTEGDSNRPSKAIKVDDSYVQTIIADAEEEFRKRAIGIEVDSFVRVLNGETRDYCGVVEAIGDGKAIVRINLKTKSILLETPLRNLLNISEVPLDRRVYYYCPLVDGLIKEQDGEGLKLIEEDLKLDDAPASETPEEHTHEPKRHSRQKTVTALVKRLILIENQHDPMTICTLVVDALKVGDIKVPKNYFIIYYIVKDNLMRNYFRKIDPDIGTYRDVINKYGKNYKFSAQQISEIDPSLKIPVLSSEEDIPEPKKGEEAPKRRGRPRKIKPSSPVVESKKKTKKKRVLSSTNKEKMIAGLKKWHASRRKVKGKK